MNGHASGSGIQTIGDCSNATKTTDSSKMFELHESSDPTKWLSLIYLSLSMLPRRHKKNQIQFQKNNTDKQYSLVATHLGKCYINGQCVELIN